MTTSLTATSAASDDNVTTLQKRLLKAVRKAGLKPVRGSLHGVDGRTDKKLRRQILQSGKELTTFLRNLDAFERRSAKSKLWIGPKPPGASIVLMSRRENND